MERGTLGGERDLEQRGSTVLWTSSKWVQHSIGSLTVELPSILAELVLTHPTVRAATSSRVLRHPIRLSTTVSPASRVPRAPEPRHIGARERRTWRNRPDTAKLPSLVNQPTGSGGQPVGLTSRGYEGATEAAVLRCVRLALGLEVKGTAHLLWKSGDIVDFDKPITNGVTLYLDATVEPYDDYYSYRGVGTAGSGSGSGAGGSGSGNGNTSISSGSHSVGGLAQRRSSARGKIHPEYSAGGYGTETVGGQRAWGSVSDLRTRSLPPTVARGGLINRFLRFWCSGDSSDVRGKSDDEQRPLLLAQSPSSSQQLHHEENAYNATVRESVAGDKRESLLGAKGSVSEGENCDAEQQRRGILKLKRILAHLANERTLLAWVRVMAKLFSAGSLSMTLAAATEGVNTAILVVLGIMYFALCPYVVFIGSSRFHQVKAVMQGTVHETYSHFAGKDLRGVNVLMSLMAALTMGVMVVQLLSNLCGFR